MTKRTSPASMKSLTKASRTTAILEAFATTVADSVQAPLASNVNISPPAPGQVVSYKELTLDHEMIGAQVGLEKIESNDRMHRPGQQDA